MRILKRNKLIFLLAIFSILFCELSDASSININSIDTSLTGEWLFRDGDNLGWKNSELSEDDWGPIQVPSMLPGGKRVKDGWYRLHINISHTMQNKDLGLFLGRIGDSDQVYFNGQLIGATGWEKSKKYFTNHINRIYKLPENIIKYNQDNVIAVRFHKEFLKGVGIFSGDIRIGDYTAIKNSVSRNYLLLNLSVFILGFVILFISLCYFSFYLVIPQLKETLYFVLSSLFISILAFTVSRVPYEFISYPQILYRINNISLILAITFLVIFGQEFFNKKHGINKAIRKINYIIPIFLVPCMIFASSYSLITTVYAWWFLYLLFAIGYLATLSIYRWIKQINNKELNKLKNLESALLSISFSIFFILMFHDVSVFMGWHAFYNLNPIGFFIITLSMAYSLAIRFAKWHQDNIALQQENLRNDHLSSIGEMIFSIVHDIKSPLGVVSSYFNGSKELLPSNAVKKEVNRLGIIVNNLFQYSAPCVLNKYPVDIHSIINDRINVFKHSLNTKKHVNITTNYFSKHYILNVDAAEIGRAIDNLLYNAIEAITNHGNIEITTRLTNENGKIIFECRLTDDGIGMTEDVQKKIFTPFFSTKKVKSNAGMGLASALKIMKFHGGSLFCKSSINNGSTFFLHFPIEQGSTA